MHPQLNRSLFFVKEHTGILKAANNFDILDPESGQILLECREETLGIFTKIFRFTKYKRMTPFDIQIRVPGGAALIRIRRGVSLFLSKVEVVDGDGKAAGYFKQKFFSIGGSFNVFDPSDKMVFGLKGKWTGWDFKFMSGERELAKVTKKWAGIGKELFTSADNYILEISSQVPPNDPTRLLILAAVMCIDMVLKE